MMLVAVVLACLLAIAFAATQIATFLIVLLIGMMPWWIAGKQHPNRVAVTVFGVLGIFVNGLWLVWVIAIVWAFAGKRSE
jgi:hypothetical protein